MSATASTFFEIPLVSTPQTFTIPLLGVTYNMTILWRDAPMAGWVLDIADANNNPIKQGIPLVTGADLLAQYGYLGFGGGLYVSTDGDFYATPVYGNLGTTAHLWFSPY